MKIVVEMTSEEFQEFLDWRKDRKMYEQDLDASFKRHEYMAKKVLWAIDRDPKKPEKVKIIDQDHGVELFELASDFFA